jgi:hypothetical protein
LQRRGVEVHQVGHGNVAVCTGAARREAREVGARAAGRHRYLVVRGSRCRGCNTAHWDRRVREAEARPEDGTLEAVLYATKRAEKYAIERLKQVALYRKTVSTPDDAVEMINKFLASRNEKTYNRKYLLNLINLGLFMLAMPQK